MMDEKILRQLNVDIEFGLLEKWIELERKKRWQPGLSVGVVYDREVIWARGFGDADLESEVLAAANTRYRIGSITKIFTATAIMQLAERGALRLDDSIRAYLPWFKIQYKGAPPITIRHILTYTSGLPLDATVPHWTENNFQTWDEIVATSAGRKAVFPPNFKWKYSNYTFTLLGGIIEVVSGQMYSEYIQSEILEPLGMTDTVVFPAEDDSRMATGYLGLPYDGRRRTAPFTHAKGYTAAFGMASTVEDLARFAILHLGDADSRVISAGTLREMHRVHWLESHWQGGSGLGFVVSQSEGRVFTSSLGEVKGYSSCLHYLELRDTVSLF